jgi:hypothetical protein
LSLFSIPNNFCIIFFLTIVICFNPIMRNTTNLKTYDAGTLRLYCSRTCKVC